ncbi:MAG: MutS-related protein, partial [Candidatus Binatia bacterium]
PEALAAWSRAPATLARPALRLAAATMVGLSAIALAAWQGGLVSPLPLAVCLALQGALGLALRRRVHAILRDVELPGRDLGLLAALLERIEREPAAAPRLAALRAALDTDGVAPSRRIAQLQRLINLLDARRNQFFAPLAPLLLWGTQLGMAIDAWRAVSGAGIERWLRAVGEFEALCALAAYAYEHPHDPFPQVREDAGPLFEGRGLGHPLLPAARCVRNDVHLGRDCAVLVISGSNMSGKSTLLRTVGINAVLAQAGAPVRAERLALSPLAVGTSMRLLDSLQAGTSHFYAEIQRLRQLVDLAAAPPPLLFLLDEVLHGTNSHDRRIGAEAVVRGLVGRGAIGLITTHDLSLAGIVDGLAPRAANVHFEDHLEGGVMTFDYRMRPGVVRKSNALELMRAVGLDV